MSPQHTRRPGKLTKSAASLQAYGFRQPIVVDTAGVIIVGHTRFAAAKKLGMATVPVHVAADLPADKAMAYGLADNRTGEESRWDEDLLGMELEALHDAGFAL